MIGSVLQDRYNAVSNALRELPETNWYHRGEV